MCVYPLIPRKKCNAIEYENDKKKDERKRINIRAVPLHVPHTPKWRQRRLLLDLGVVRDWLAILLTDTSYNSIMLQIQWRIRSVDVSGSERIVDKRLILIMRWHSISMKYSYYCYFLFYDLKNQIKWFVFVWILEKRQMGREMGNRGKSNYYLTSICFIFLWRPIKTFGTLTRFLLGPINFI